MSAVSNSVMPRSIALWITLREVSRSVRWPKLLQPRPMAETRRPEPPRLRISMDQSCAAFFKRAAHCDLMELTRKAGRWRRNNPETRETSMKKKRPRSDAATDGDRWGARMIVDGGPDQTQCNASPAL